MPTELLFTLQLSLPLIEQYCRSVRDVQAALPMASDKPATASSRPKCTKKKNKTWKTDKQTYNLTHAARMQETKQASKQASKPPTDRPTDRASERASKAKQSKAKQSKAMQSKAKQSKAKQASKRGAKLATSQTNKPGSAGQSVNPPAGGLVSLLADLSKHQSKCPSVNPSTCQPIHFLLIKLAKRYKATRENVRLGKAIQGNGGQR